MPKSSDLSVRILAAAGQLPEHYYSQEDLLAGLEAIWGQRHFNLQRLRQFHRAMQVEGRFLCLPKEQYLAASDFTQRNRQFVECALPLAQSLLTRVLTQQGLKAQDIDYLVTTTVTGLAVPSLEARLMNRLPFRPDLKRLPLFGLGCLGGAAGVARLADLLWGRPALGLLLSVELCSLTLQPQDLSPANLVASGLFGDGAAAVIMSSRPQDSRGPRVLASRSVFFPDSENVMGWQIGSHGFQVVLSPEVPDYAGQHLAPALVNFLQDWGLQIADIALWVAHPGGPKVVTALQAACQLPDEAFQLTRDSLREVGNLSSASVLFVLEASLQTSPEPGQYGLLLAMGPAFCAELVLIQW